MEREHDIGSDRVTIARCREILRDEADELSDADVELIGKQAELIAHAMVEMFLEQQVAHE